MERVVGVTLILLGVYVFTALVRHGREFRMRSRWMLIFSGVQVAFRKVRGDAGARPTTSSPSTGTPSRNRRCRSPSPKTSRCPNGTTATTGVRATITTSTRSRATTPS